MSHAYIYPRFHYYYQAELRAERGSPRRIISRNCASDPGRLHPTLSSWLMNMNTLSSLINQLHDLATAAPQEHQPRLKRQVIALRTALKRQQERCIAFLQLTEKYADKFLSDITEEIQQQSSFLDALERRLAMANNLREQVVHLHKSYEDGTLDCIKKVRRTVLSQPLPQDIDFFKEMDRILREIQRCYIEMDRFWIDEVCRVTKALKDRRIDPEDIDHWRRFRESLKQAITKWGTRSAESDSSAFVPHINPQPSEHDLCSVVPFLSDAALAAKRALRRMWLSASAALNLVKGTHRSLMLGAEVKFTENCKSCVEFFQECVRYGETVMMACTSFTSYSPFLRSRTSQDLVDRATRLGTERNEVVVYISIQDVPRFNSIHEKSLSSLEQMDDKLEGLLTYIPAWVTQMDAHSTFPVFNIMYLQALFRIWVKNRGILQHVSAIPQAVLDPTTFPPLLETGQ